MEQRIGSNGSAQRRAMIASFGKPSLGDTAAPEGHDPQHLSLARKGFAVFPEMTTEADVGAIRELIIGVLDSDRFHAARRDIGSGAKDAPPIVELINLVQIEPRLKESLFFKRAETFTRSLFGDAVRFRFDHVIEKGPRTTQPTKWHQDCAYSSRLTLSARKLHWWLPLQPVTVENGCMAFAEGSHLGPVRRHSRHGAFGHARSAHGPLEGEIVDCPLPIGGATVHLPKTLHYTGPNSTDDRRLAWIVHFGIRGWPPTLL